MAITSGEGGPRRSKRIRGHDATTEPSPVDEDEAKVMTQPSTKAVIPADRSTANFFKIGSLYDDPAGFKQHLETLSQADQVQLLAAKAEEYSRITGRVYHIAEFMDTLAESQGIKAIIKAQAGDLWKEIEEGADKHRQLRNEKAESMRTVYLHWSRTNIERDIPNLDELGNATIKAFRALALAAHQHNVTYDDVKRQVLSAQFKRICTPKKGVSNLKTIQATDLNNAAQAIRAGEAFALDQKDLSSIGCGVNTKGFICAAEDVSAVALVIGGEGEGPAFRGSEPRSGGTPVADNSARAGPDAEDDLDQIAEIETEKYNRGGADFDATYIGAQYEAESGGDEEGPPRKKQKTDTVDKRECGCSESIPSGFLSHIKSGTTVFNAAGKSNLIRSWKAHSNAGTMCYSHHRHVMSVMGLKTRGLTSQGLEQRLSIYHDATLNGTLGSLTTGDATYKWFRRSSRPVHPNDRLGPYKFGAGKATFDIAAKDQGDVLRFLGIGVNKWKKDGSLNLGIFKWWLEKKYSGPQREYHGKTMRDLALEEFDMYDHPPRHIDGRPNYGWLRTMFHGIAQQAMRQDPVYFMVYSALREDRNTNLISYPYYAKYQKPGDSTSFRHIDVNIVRLVEHGRGKYQIQGTLSLDDEQEDDCTEIVPGLHNKSKEWYRLLKTRGFKFGGLVHSISSEAFTKEDAIKFNTNWTAVPCSAGQIRITQPHLPHGAKGPAKRVRRTMAPWLVGLQPDLYHLEITEGGTFEDLSKAHRDLNSGPYTPSGLANRYGDIPYPFPAAVAFAGMGALSDAIVGRIRHDNAEVRYEKELLLKGSDVNRAAFIDAWRSKAIEEAFRIFAIVRVAEKAAFGNKSFFAKKDGDVAADASADADDDPAT